MLRESKTRLTPQVLLLRHIIRSNQHNRFVENKNDTVITTPEHLVDRLVQGLCYFGWHEFLLEVVLEANPDCVLFLFVCGDVGKF